MVSETLKLARSDNRPWGFRLSGGKDFGVVLTVQKVNPGSLAAEKGMQTGDAVLSINGVDTTELRHKEVQDTVLHAGNSLEITVERGGAANWKPANNNQYSPSMESQINLMNSTSSYSYATIAETLTAHAEMIAPGVMGINFMKPEHPVNTTSEVYRLVQEEQMSKTNSPTPPTTPPVMAPRRSAPLAKTPPPPVAPKPTPVAAPMPASAPAPLPMMNSHSTPAPQVGFKKAPPPPPPQSQGSCSDCGRYITSNFVRVEDKILHEDCFRCSTCGTSLQNTGYVSLNLKLYCEVHAKLAAKVIASELLDSAPAPFISELPRISPMAPPPPLPMTPQQQAPMAPQQPPSAQFSHPPPHVPLIDNYLKGPTPYIPPGQNLGNLPQTPSSSGGLAFRSISPQPFKRISGDFHRVAAPSSPIPTMTPSLPYDSGAGLPFESKPYMPLEQSMSTMSSSTQISEVSQSYQQTTTVNQQSSQYQVDYRQVVGSQKGTKFVWPPQRPDEMLFSENAPSAPAPPQQHYSPLATQSSPPEAQPTSTISQPPPVPEFPPSQIKPSLPTPYVPPPLPSTFSRPAEQQQDQPQLIIPPAAPPPDDMIPAMSAEQIIPIVPAAPVVPAAPPVPTGVPASSISIPGFSPVLAHIIDETKKDGMADVPQSGVPTGAGSRAAPRRGKGQLKEQIPGCRIPICADCGSPIRGPFIIALSKTWCPDHFHCNNLHCKNALQGVGFVEEQGQLYCETCYEAFLAPICNKCGSRIKGDCLNALGKSWHPECFLCAHCHKPFGNSSFYLEDALPYCEKDWNELFTTKCVGCGYPIEAGDRWVEALNNNYHSQCFKCSVCSKNLEGQSFYAKGGRPFCKAHAR